MSHANPYECYYLCCRACCRIAYPLYATGWSANYEGVQRQVPSGKNLWRPGRTKLERFPQDSMRDECCSHSCGDNPRGNPRRNACGAESSWEPGLPNGRVAEVHERIRWQSPHAHLRRPIQNQQSEQCQRWVEMD